MTHELARWSDDARPVLNPASPLRTLLDAPVRAGVVTWIGVRPRRRLPMVVLERVALDPAHGLAGDRHGSGMSKARQVTLIGVEDLAAIASFVGAEIVAPDRLRRNVVVRGINLAVLKDRRIRLGTAVLQVTGQCHPCSRMEEALGPGGYNAVRGHGGITARVVGAGEVSLGDALVRLDDPENTGGNGS